MAEVNGKLVSCDRCGKQIFLQCTGEGERDGGYTRWNKFQPYPEGWKWHSEVGRFCPACNEKYEALIETFMTEGRDNGGKQN